jgi:SARP family transcriptional regulator, regulator of embCAB operon
MRKIRERVVDANQATTLTRQIRLHLLGGFRLERNGTALSIPEGSQRLLAFLALKGRSVQRQAVAGNLWPDATEGHAASSLRSSLARLPREARTSVSATSKDLRLSDDVTVDLWEARVLAHQLLDSGTSPSRGPRPEGIPALSGELLPDWYEEWTLLEAEEWRQLRLHALEALADRLTANGEFGEAAAAALAAVRAEPLRESPRAALIRVHVAEGNPTEALREFSRYDELLMLEMGVGPTERLRGLVVDLEETPP